MKEVSWQFTLDGNKGQRCVASTTQQQGTKVVFEENKSWNWEDSQEGGTLDISQGSFTIFSITSSGKTKVEEPITPKSNSINTMVCPQTESSQASEGEYSEVRNFRLLSDVCDEIEEIELEEELLLAGVDEPRNYSEAVVEPGWEEATKNEFRAIEKINTWKLVELPAGKQAINLKWVYKLKRDTSGKILKYKARLVAKGYV